MSDELNQKIALLERKIAREREARKTAEKQLEDYSRQIYLSNQALQRSLSSSHKRQRELEYLANASANVASDHDLADLLQTTADMTASFAHATTALYVITENNKSLSSLNNPLWFGDNDWRIDPELCKTIVALMPEQDQILDNWLILDISGALEDFNIASHWLVCLNFKLVNNKIGWLVFVLNNELLDEETLYVLDTAKSHIRSGVAKRVNKRKLEQKNRQLKQAVTRLEKAQSQLVHSEKMASLGQLVAGIAHEINNPIGYILSNQKILSEYIIDMKCLFLAISERLEKSVPVTNEWLQKMFDTSDFLFLLEDIESLVKDNEDGANKVTEIVKSLKTFSHSGDIEYADMDIADCISKVEKMAGGYLKSVDQLEIDIPEKLPIVSGNAGQIQQVLLNLLVNAAQAVNERGHITVTVKPFEHHIDIAISDNGCGMNKTVMSQLFTPFFTTKEIGEGTGLGLSVSHGIVEAHGGEITVESEIGQGSTFTVSLPLHVAV